MAAAYTGAMAFVDDVVDVSDALAGDGIAIRRNVLDAELVARLAEATDRAFAREAAEFPPGDEQFGRALFPAEYGGAFVELLEQEALLGPLEALLGPGSIVYTMTTSVVVSDRSSPAADFHVDLPPSRPSGLALGFIALLDRFDEASGATEFRLGSHLVLDDHEASLLPVHRIEGEPGDVCYFDPRIRHRAGRNRTDRPRRGVLVLLVQPWMKQRFDITTMVPPEVRAGLSPEAARRLGFDALPPGSHEEFLARRRQRPW